MHKRRPQTQRLAFLTKKSVFRVTIQEFFDALREQKISPLVDTQAVRAGVDARVRALCVSYPIPGRWPVLDLESAYQQTLNELPNVPDLVSDGYRRTVNLRGYDNIYRWSNGLAISPSSGPPISGAMLALLPPASTLSSPRLRAYKNANRALRGLWLRRLLDR